MHLGRVLAILAFGVAAASVRAEDAPPHFEVFSGTAVSQTSWISWFGGVHSLSGSLYESGWRIRLSGAYGGYRYEMDDGTNQATPALVEFTPGYQFRAGPVISKIYLGLHAEQHQLDRPDPDNSAAGFGYGAKLISENWLDLPFNSFASLDLSYSTRNDAYLASVRAGSSHFISTLQFGPEAQLVGNREHYQMRFGGLLRWQLQTGSLEGSAGLSCNDDGNSSPYAGVSYVKRF